MNQSPDGVLDIGVPCFEPVYYYQVTNTGDTYISDIEVWDDEGLPEDPSAKILIGVIPGPLAPGESAFLEYVSTGVSVRLNRAVASGVPSSEFGDNYYGKELVTAEDTALTYKLMNC